MRLTATPRGARWASRTKAALQSSSANRIPVCVSKVIAAVSLRTAGELQTIPSPGKGDVYTGTPLMRFGAPRATSPPLPASLAGEQPPTTFLRSTADCRSGGLPGLFHPGATWGSERAWYIAKSVPEPYSAERPSDAVVLVSPLTEASERDHTQCVPRVPGLPNLQHGDRPKASRGEGCRCLAPTSFAPKRGRRGDRDPDVSGGCVARAEAKTSPSTERCVAP